jgi:catechol 2,3-dioxygenase-like lactoylglutathione lyase family enzyme
LAKSRSFSFPGAAWFAGSLLDAPPALRAAKPPLREKPEGDAKRRLAILSAAEPRRGAPRPARRGLTRLAGFAFALVQPGTRLESTSAPRLASRPERALLSAIASSDGASERPCRVMTMSIKLNHTIVPARDKNVSASFLTEILGLRAPTRFGPFMTVELDNEVTLDFIDSTGQILMRHYAFLVGEKEFDQILARIRERGLGYWADPYKGRPNEINTADGGRTVYFDDPDGHKLEILTRPYGSGSP